MNSPLPDPRSPRPCQGRPSISLCLLACLPFIAGPATAAQEVLVLGDSLSKEYEVEFPHLDAANWIEILDDERHEDFDAGSFETFADFRATGHEYNWSLPGATTQDIWERLTDDGFFDERAQEELEDHLEDEVNRVVIFLGGNDVEKEYGRLYENQESDQITDRIFKNLESILGWVKERNPSLPIVLVNVPHVGATPKVQKEQGTDPQKVANVTRSLRDLNARLRALAEAEGVGYADVFAITMDLLEEKPFCISGVRFLDESHPNAAKFYLWLGGSVASEFHPNTNGQARVANAIIQAFNERYAAGIIPLGGTEILRLLDIESDRTYAEWAECYALGTPSGPEADADGDGRTNFTEFVFDTDPASPADAALTQVTSTGHIRFRPRLRTSNHFQWTLEHSSDLRQWQPVPLETVEEGAFGTYTWRPGPETAASFYRFRLSE